MEDTSATHLEVAEIDDVEGTVGGMEGDVDRSVERRPVERADRAILEGDPDERPPLGGSLGPRDRAFVAEEGDDQVVASGDRREPGRGLVRLEADQGAWRRPELGVVGQEEPGAGPRRET